MLMYIIYVTWNIVLGGVEETDHLKVNGPLNPDR